MLVLDQNRANALRRRAHATKHLSGGGSLVGMAEVGVYQGGSAAIMLETPGTLHLYDTFAGMPETTGIDVHQKGDFADTSLESVRAFLNNPRAIFHPGLFPDTFAALLPEIQCTRLRLVHLDGDLYQTTKAGLEIFWPRLVPGGCLVIDDWHWPLCPGVDKAVLEFFDSSVAFVEEAKYQLIVVK